MDRVTVELLDDEYAPTTGEEQGPDLAQAPTEVGVRYLMGLGMVEMDARHIVAVAKGEISATSGHASDRRTQPRS